MNEWFILHLKALPNRLLLAAYLLATSQKRATVSHLSQSATRLSVIPRFFYTGKKRDHSLLDNCLSGEVSQLPETYATTFRTFKNFLLQIQNALRYSYSNEPLNPIKVLK